MLHAVTSPGLIVLACSWFVKWLSLFVLMCGVWGGGKREGSDVSPQDFDGRWVLNATS